MRDALKLARGAADDWFIKESAMNHKDNEHSVRRIVLPSGKSIEVVRFQDAESKPSGLHVCACCGSSLVQPVSWNDVSEDRWELTLECPNCWTAVQGIYDREQVDELEEQLDDGLAELLADLKRLAHANMADQMSRFIAALDDDQILPEDF